jgi:hypothetical protein
VGRHGQHRQPYGVARPGRPHPVSEATYRRLRKRYRSDERGVVYVKGKGEMVTYFLVGKR